MTMHAPRFLLAAALALAPASASGLERVIYLVSETARGMSAEGASQGPAVTHDGQAVAYHSTALNLVSPPFQNFREQVYLREIAITASQLVSRNPDDGRAGNGPSSPGGFAPGVSGDGRFVAFSSSATNLVADDPNGPIADIFVYDRDANTMALITRASDGGGANGASTFPRLSGDGRYVVFQSAASNLVEGDGNGTTDIFVHDRDSGETVRVSVAADGTESNGQSLTPGISADGRVVAFASRATNLVDTPVSGAFEQIFATAWQERAIRLVSVNDAGQAGNRISFLPVLTADGATVAFKSEAFNLVPGDTNGVPDIFVREDEQTTRVSVDSFGNQSNGLSGGPAISADGRFVAFISFASNFVPEDGNGFGDVYVYDRFPPDRDQGVIARVSVAMNGGEPNAGVSDFPVSIAGDGRWIGFASSASNLVPNDFNNSVDVFLACNPFDAFQCAPPTPVPTPTATPGSGPCVGDCGGDGQVTIDDLIRMVNIALGLQSVCGTDGAGQCLAGDANCDCEITVDEIILAVQNSLNGCQHFGSCPLAEHAEMCCGGPIVTPTPTPTADAPTPTPTSDDPGATPTATPEGPLGACVGDCSGDGVVTIDELIRMVNVALGTAPLCGAGGCLAGDRSCDCEITVDDIVTAVNNTLNGCSIYGDCSPEDHELLCCAV